MRRLRARVLTVPFLYIFATAYITTNATPSSLRTPPITIATWNVLHQTPLLKYGNHTHTARQTLLSEPVRREKFKRALATAVHDHGVDVFCLQEVSQLWLKDRHMLEEFHIFCRGTVAVLVRRSFHGSEHDLESAALGLTRRAEGRDGTSLRPLRDTTPVEDRGVTNNLVRVKIPLNLTTTVCIVSAHLPFIQPEGMLHAAALRRAFWGIVDSCSLYVVAGDYNIDADHELLRDLLRACPSSDARTLPGVYHTARNVLNGSEMLIDHVVTSAPKIERVAVVPELLESLLPQGAKDSGAWHAGQGSWPSDHAMVVARVLW